jgi:hypothetical protein
MENIQYITSRAAKCIIFLWAEGHTGENIHLYDQKILDNI